MKIKVLNLDINTLRSYPDERCTKIPEFKQLIERDRTQGKYKAVRELAAIQLMSDFDSPYITYSPEDYRLERINKDLFKGEWEPDIEWKAALKKYRELTETPYLQLLKSAFEAAMKMKKYFDGVDYAVDKPKDVQSVIGTLDKTINGLIALEETVIRQEQGASKTRGDVTLTRFNK
jgi:hypothetical protein